MRKSFVVSPRIGRLGVGVLLLVCAGGSNPAAVLYTKQDFIEKNPRTIAALAREALLLASVQQRALTSADALPSQNRPSTTGSTQGSPMARALAQHPMQDASFHAVGPGVCVSLSHLPHVL